LRDRVPAPNVSPVESAYRRRRVLLLHAVVATLASGCTREAVVDDHRDAAPDVVVAAQPTSQPAPPPMAGSDPPAKDIPLPFPWTEKIRWRAFAAGMREARVEKKPVCLVFYTTWCPHCRNFSHVFEDDRVVERARDFVMIRLDADEEVELNRMYAPDGSYIPRTLFLAPDGTLERSIHAPNRKHQFFYDERQPEELVVAMQAALRKLQSVVR